MAKKTRPRRVWNGISVQPSIKPVFPIVKDETWRERVENLNGIKFDDNAKLKFLKELDRTGKIGLACQVAGVSTTSWRTHARKDPKFLEAVEHTIKVFNESRAAQIEKQAIDGFREVIFGPNGEKAYRRRYETQLRVMVLKAADKELYADHSTVDVNVQGGAFIIPATLNPDDWEKQFAEQQARFIPDTAPNLFVTQGEEVPDELQPVKRPGKTE